MAQGCKIEESITSSFRLLAFCLPTAWMLFIVWFLSFKKISYIKEFYDNDDQIKIELLIYQLTYKIDKDIF